MKRMKLISQVILTLVIILVLSVQSSCSKSTPANSTQETNDSKSNQAVVFINTDSLLMEYEFAKELNETLVSKEEQSRASFNEQAKVFQQDATEFQRKVQNNGFLSLERAKMEEQRLAKKERELQDLNSRLSNNLMQEQNRVNRQLRDTLVAYLKELELTKKYKMVLSNTMGDNVLYYTADVDITKEVVAALNKRYTANKDKK